MSVKLLPSSLSATFWASPFRRRLLASMLAFWCWKYSRFALVARSAFFLGSRKLRAKPSFTFTSSPIWPSFSTRSSRITCMVVLLLHDVGQQRHEAGALDGVGQDALLLVADGGDAARHDLATLGNEALQELDVLVVDLGRVRAREGAGLLATEERTTGAVLTTATAAFAVTATFTVAARATFAIATIAHCTVSSVSPSAFSALSSRRFLFDEVSNWSTLTVM